jgi:protein-disulfide isomerase
MEEWFYTHQAQLTPPSVRQAVKEIGEVTDFDAKYAAALELVKSDIELSYQVHVSQTPTFFVNGVKLDGMIAPQYFDKMIAYELQHAPK